MTLKLGWITTVIASSRETAKEILRKHDKTFSAPTVPHAVASQPNSEATLAWVPPDNMWRNRRRICNTQMFTNQRLDSLQELRHQKAELLVKYIRKQCTSGSAVNVGRVAFATTLNLVSRTIFSIDMVDPEFEKAQEFKDLVWRIMEDSGKPNLSDYFPVLKWLDLQGVRRHIRPAYLRLHEIFEQQIEKRVQERAEGMKKKGDFLDVLLDQCEDEGSGFDGNTIKHRFVDLFIAGSDTSAATTEWAMAELLRKPQELNKVRQEIIQQIGIERPVKESDMDKLSYLQIVVKETLRLHPAVPLLLPRKALNDSTEVLGYTVPKDSQVLVNAWAIGRDSESWVKPLEFLPERFIKSSHVDYKGRDFEFIPFGAGRRICPGMPLAIRMVNLMLASIIQPFNWKLPDGMTPESLDMKEQFGITLRKAIPLVAAPSMEQK